MKLQKFTTESTEEKNFRFVKSSAYSVVASSQKEFPLTGITGQIISCAIDVHSALGPGLLEGLYEEALIHEFGLRGIKCERQKEIVLNYKGKGIGKHKIDVIVEDQIIVELKAVEDMHKIYEAQLLTYLRAM